MSSGALTFHHVGLVSREPIRSRAFLTSLGYEIGPVVTEAAQNLCFSMCSSPTLPCLALMWPIAAGGPLDRVLQTTDAHLNHICFATHDRAQALHQLREDGHTLVSVTPPRTSLVLQGATVSFHYVSGLGLIEILEHAKV